MIPWEPSAAIATITALAALLFMRKDKQQHFRLHQKILFWLGLGSIYFVLQTQFEYYAEHAFFIHQMQQGVLHHLGPFLIALSGAFMYEKKRQEQRKSFLANPIVAVLLFNGLIIFWLLPPIHAIAMLDWRLYRLMSASMILNGLMFWHMVLSSRHSASSRIITMLALIPPQIVTGALVFFTQHELYPVYSLCGRIFTGISPMTDQQIGGLILWLSGPMMSAIGILVVAYREWMQVKHLA